MSDDNDSSSSDEIQAAIGSFYRTQVFDEEKGIALPVMKMNCFICKTEKSMIMFIDDKGKLSIYDCYCYACDVGNATMESTKRFIDGFRKERYSLLRFPDEKFGAYIEVIKENNPEIVLMVHNLIEDAKVLNPIAIETINNMRSTKTYKAYPKSLGDENRLFMTISSYFERFEHRFEGKNEKEKFDEIIRLLKQDQA
jgi:hypothetical protein